MIARCSCGAVELEAAGAPITTAACYCGNCREGSRRIEALPGAVRVRDADDATTYVLYRKDRIEVSRGAEHLRGSKLDAASATSRVVAACCGSAMMMRFEDSKHWVPVYRARFGADAPPVRWRICTEDRAEGVEIPRDVPASATYPLGFLAKLLTSRLAMLLQR